MTIQPQEISLDLIPQYRFEIIDITKKISEIINGDKDRYRSKCEYLVWVRSEVVCIN